MDHTEHTLTILLASLLNWYTCSASPHRGTSGTQSWGKLFGSTNKCADSEGSLRTYCSVPYTGPKSLLFKHIYTVLMLQLQYNCVCSQSDGRNWIWRERSKDRCIWPTSKAIHPLCSAPTPPAHRRAAAGTAAGLPPPLHSSRRHRRRRHTALL